MTRDDKFNIKRRTEFRRLLTIGSEATPLRIAAFALYVFDFIWVWGNRAAASAFANSMVVPSPLTEFIFRQSARAYLMEGIMLLLVLYRSLAARASRCGYGRTSKRQSRRP